ncbi:MAG TPA: rRNA maturation RNase YbeY [Anaerolineae bacterium]
MRIDVHVALRQAETIRAAALKQAALAALDVARVRRAAALTIVIAGDATLRKLNREFLGIDAPTDVLSFPTARSGTSAEQKEYLGDVILSLARAKAQAKQGGHPLVDELRLLVIHGVLHLLGYDHDTPERQRRMWSAQARALRKVNASIEGPATLSIEIRAHTLNLTL